MKTGNKAQVSMFIVIGLVIALIIALIYVLIAGLPSITLSREYTTKGFVENCLSEISKDSITVFGKQGGKMELEKPYFEPLGTSYLLLNNTNRVPTIEEAEKELAGYIEKKISLCTKNFEALRKQGIIVTEVSKPSARVIIAEKDVMFQLDYVIKEKKGDTETTYSEFSPHSEALMLKPILETANAIVDSQINNDGKIDLSIETPHKVTFFPYTKKLVVVIEELSYSANHGPYKFVFAQD